MNKDFQYIVPMFPYPSGNGLHIGHYYNYAIVDSYCRWQRLKGAKVFQPFGYDAFGLPAENYARSIGGDPREITYENINKFRSQMEHMNTQYEEKLITSDKSYIKWTQWLFTKLLEKGLAYKTYGNVNYCSSCATVLANEQVKDKKCDRCETVVETKNLNQWYFKITAYKDRLIKNLDTIDYPASTIKQQRDWLTNLHDWCVSRQRNWGCPIPIEGETDTLDTFVDSSFYYLRYLTNSEEELLPKDAYKQVDLYVGGREHACMHLIYARFIHMFLYDLGIVPVEEPFKKVIHQGMITFQRNKMSKSKGNTVEPDKYNSDQLRMFLMFLGPYVQGGEWNDEQIIGIERFLNKMKKWLGTASDETGKEIDTADFFKSIELAVSTFKFNLVVANFMKFINNNKNTIPNIVSANRIVNILKCFAPGF